VTTERGFRPEPSSCSCHLPDGAWGSGGWHYTRYRNNPEGAKLEGEPFVYERCPRYMEACARKAAA
jgi:hypothetical protein